tara:strand:- start:3563 stop:3964 length:402 start_codon:yes stop_codon:yes gene_type:complete
VVSCNINNDCGECFTPPRQFNFEFVDKDTDENLFKNNTFDKAAVVVFDEKNANINFQIVFYNEKYILSLSEIGWDLKPKVYTVKLSKDVSVIFELNMDTISENCCTYFIVEAFNLQTYEYSESSTTGIINIKI